MPPNHKILDLTPFAIYAELTITGSRTKTLKAFVAKTPESFTSGYDYDGNLLLDGRWNYTYDAENRLATAETNSAVVAAGVTRQKLTFAYDYLGRRVGKLVESGWNSTTSTYDAIDASVHYLYDGWNLLWEFDAHNSLAPLRSYLWGLDNSGTLQGAGGVGGLLFAWDFANSVYGSPITDGMGNIHGQADYYTGAVQCAFEYDAFGNNLRESGAHAELSFFRYSTKYTDLETGLVYYGLRYYSPSLGRFLNKDPIQEQGGLNLYGFCGNNGVNRWDYLGQWPSWDTWFTRLFGLTVHQNSDNRILPASGFNGASLDSINRMNASFDTRPGSQNEANSSWHAMLSSVPANTVTDLANIEDRISNQIGRLNSPDTATSDDAFGALLHFFQDATSPSHVNQSTGIPQRWDSDNLFNIIPHVLGELFDPGKNSDLDKATQFVANLKSGAFQFQDDTPKLAQFFAAIGNNKAADGYTQFVNNAPAAQGQQVYQEIQHAIWSNNVDLMVQKAQQQQNTFNAVMADMASFSLDGVTNWKGQLAQASMTGDPRVYAAVANAIASQEEMKKEGKKEKKGR